MTAQPTYADAPNVVVTIKPIHSLVAGVMRGVGEPALLVNGASSPHNYQLKPSERRLIDASDLFIWVGENLEFFAARIVDNLSAETRVITLLELTTVDAVRARQGGLIDDHGDHTHAHGHGAHDAGTGTQQTDEDHGVDTDVHIWLDADNAKAIVRAAADALSEIDPSNRDRYRINAQDTVDAIATLDADIAERLTPLTGLRFVVLHDAYQYFEQRYGLTPQAIVTVQVDRPTGAKRITDIRRRIADNSIDCVFTEPQFSPKVVATLTEGTAVHVGELDPIGADIAAGHQAWFQLLAHLADEFVACGR